jgi:hypothetical protein
MKTLEVIANAVTMGKSVKKGQTLGRVDDSLAQHLIDSGVAVEVKDLGAAPENKSGSASPAAPRSRKKTAKKSGVKARQ